jgi:hypothetical protein
MKPDSDEEGSKDYYDSLAKVEEAIDQECIKEKLNLPQNGHKAIMEHEATVLIVSAKSKCIKTSLFDFGEAFLKFVVPKSDRTENDTFCVKYKLKNLESNATLSNNDDEKTRCEHYLFEINIYSSLQWDYAKENGHIIESTCEVFTYDIVDMISYRTLLLSVEKDKDIKENGMKELFEYATDKLHKLADCILERIE